MTGLADMQAEIQHLRELPIVSMMTEITLPPKSVYVPFRRGELSMSYELIDQPSRNRQHAAQGTILIMGPKWWHAIMACGVINNAILSSW